MNLIRSAVVASVVVLTACGSQQETEVLAQAEPTSTETAVSNVQESIDYGACVGDDAFDQLSLVGLFDWPETWTEVTRANLATFVRLGQESAGEVVAPGAALEVEMVVGEPLERYVRVRTRALDIGLTDQSVTRYIFGLTHVTRDGFDDVGSPAPLVLVHDDKDIEFVGNCMERTTSVFRSYVESLDGERTQYEVLRGILTDPNEKQRFRDDRLPSDPTAWEQLDPQRRFLEPGVAPDDVFDDLYQVDFDVDLPDWWPDLSADYGICARIDRGWMDVCIGDLVTKPDQLIGLDAWVASDGQIEIHLITQGAGAMKSEALLAAVDVSELRTRTILVEFRESLRSAADLIEAANGRETILDFTQLPGIVSDEPGLPSTAELVDAAPTN